MSRTIPGGAPLAAMLVLLLSTSGAAHASVLCKNRHGGLLVREVCKRFEETLDAPALGALGLRGPAGPAGPVGPAGGGLKVLDANANEVGLVTALHSYYGQYADVVRQMTLPGGSGPEFILFSVAPTGLRTSYGYGYGCFGYYGTYFRTAECSGEQLRSCNGSDGCSSADGAFLYTRLRPTEGGTACFVRGGAEFEHGTFYRSLDVSGASIVAATQQCDAQGGQLTAPVAPCDFNPLFFCGACCTPQPDVNVAPIHTVDLSGVGTPPFRLGR